MSDFTLQQREHIFSVKQKVAKFIDDMRQEDWFKHTITSQQIILTGGVFASLLNNEEPKDWDFYFLKYSDMQVFDQAVKNNWRNDIADIEENYKEILGEDGKMITANSITMKNKASFITMITGTPEEIRTHFDYVHCMPYYSLYDNRLYISKQQYMACTQKALIINNELSFKPYRHDKFIKRGFKPNYEVPSIYIEGNTIIKHSNAVTYNGNNS